jgi:hypothetical protein
MEGPEPDSINDENRGRRCVTQQQIEQLKITKLDHKNKNLILCVVIESLQE